MVELITWYMTYVSLYDICFILRGVELSTIPYSPFYGSFSVAPTTSLMNISLQFFKEKKKKTRLAYTRYA